MVEGSEESSSEDVGEYQESLTESGKFCLV